jgi:hypothetical protein
MENRTDTSSEPVACENKRRKTFSFASLILGMFGFLALCFGLAYWWLGSYFIPFPPSWTVDQGLLMLLLITIICPLFLSLGAIVVGALLFRKHTTRPRVAIAGIIIGLLTILCLLVPLVQIILTWLFAHSGQTMF